MADDNAVPDDENDAPVSEAERQPQKPDVPPEVKRALRQANKEAETLRLKLKEFEDRDKTEMQKAAERLTAAESEAASTRRELARYKVAAAKGVPAELLTGDDEGAMEASAEALLAFRGDTQKRPPSFGGGPRPVADTGTDMNQLIRTAAGRA